MQYFCEECGLAGKVEPVCPKCDDNMKLLVKKNYIVDIHGSIEVKAIDEEDAYNQVVEMIEEAKEKISAKDELVNVLQADSETITEL